MSWVIVVNGVQLIIEREDKKNIDIFSSSEEMHVLRENAQKIGIFFEQRYDHDCNETSLVIGKEHELNKETECLSPKSSPAQEKLLENVKKYLATNDFIVKKELQGIVLCNY